ncbi:MAG: hypothetical protein P8Q89_02010, partial [Alphaproteobacteria bacterium]|nr:hypothetical protein [Alphaproteobacteria bacterium]
MGEDAIANETTPLELRADLADLPGQPAVLFSATTVLAVSSTGALTLLQGRPDIGTSYDVIGEGIADGAKFTLLGERDVFLPEITDPVIAAAQYAALPSDPFDPASLPSPAPEVGSFWRSTLGGLDALLRVTAVSQTGELSFELLEGTLEDPPVDATTGDAFDATLVPFGYEIAREGRLGLVAVDAAAGAAPT